MNYKDLSRPLEISDVDFRVQSINNGGYATILAYKDARVDMNRLDEVLTPIGWQRDYKLIDGKLFCGVGIYNEASDRWIWKWDVGTESMTEAQKGQASDAFKRACFNLGIGRELYDYPLISIKLKDDEWSKDGGRPKQTYNLKIKDWRWYSEFTDGRISFLAAKDQNNEVRFKWGTMKPKTEEPSYVPASGSPEALATDDTVNIPEAAPIVEKVSEEANFQGILKKKADNSEEYDLAVSEYTSVFGKKPHHKMLIDRIIEETKNELNRIAAEELQENEEPLVPTQEVEEILEVEEEEKKESILNFIDEISEYRDPSKFVEWAKGKVTKFTGIDSPEDVAAFKQLCNDHYGKIN